MRAGQKGNLEKVTQEDDTKQLECFPLMSLNFRKMTHFVQLSYQINNLW